MDNASQCGAEGDSQDDEEEEDGKPKEKPLLQDSDL